MATLPPASAVRMPATPSSVRLSGKPPILSRSSKVNATVLPPKSTTPSRCWRAKFPSNHALYSMAENTWYQCLGFAPKFMS